MPQILFDKLPASGGERGIGISRFKGNINHDTANNATLANLYEQDKESIQTGFAIGKGLSQNFATFMNDMAKDMDSVANAPAVGKDGKPIIKDGKQLTNQEAYQAGLELGDTVNKAGDTINYGTRQDLWGSGGTANIIATALIGAYSGNVSNGASTLLQNTAINVVRAYSATEIKRLADSFSIETDDKGNPIPNATSETVRGLLHAIAGCAGASATGGDCTSAGLASAGTVAMNNAMTALLNLNPNDMTDTQKQAYSNLMGTLVAGVSTAVGGDAAAAQLASKVEVENNETYSNYVNGPRHSSYANNGGVDASKVNSADRTTRGLARKSCIMNAGSTGVTCFFEVKNDLPGQGLSAPIYELDLMSEVKRLDSFIVSSANKWGVDPDLARAIMYMETTHGYYDVILATVDKNKSILPMNINQSYWGAMFGTRASLKDEKFNIDQGVRILSYLQKYTTGDYNISKIATLYNDLSATSVNDYGRRVLSIYRDKPWSH